MEGLPGQKGQKGDDGPLGLTGPKGDRVSDWKKKFGWQINLKPSILKTCKTQVKLDVIINNQTLFQFTLCTENILETDF